MPKTIIATITDNDKIRFQEIYDKLDEESQYWLQIESLSGVTRILTLDTLKSFLEKSFVYINADLVDKVCKKIHPLMPFLKRGGTKPNGYTEFYTEIVGSITDILEKDKKYRCISRDGNGNHIIKVDGDALDVMILEYKDHGFDIIDIADFFQEELGISNNKKNNETPRLNNKNKISITEDQKNLLGKTKANDLVRSFMIESLLSFNSEPYECAHVISYIEKFVGPIYHLLPNQREYGLINGNIASVSEYFSKKKFIERGGSKGSNLGKGIWKNLVNHQTLRNSINLSTQDAVNTAREIYNNSNKFNDNFQSNNSEHFLIKEPVIEKFATDYLLEIKEKTKLDQASVKQQYTIQMGARKGRPDVVLENYNGSLPVIIECKKSGHTGDGPDQLQSYLNSQAAQFGIFANDENTGSWKFYENLGMNQFNEISKDHFESKFSLEVTKSKVSSLTLENERLKNENRNLNQKYQDLLKFVRSIESQIKETL